ncbi:hypothetical protein AAY473_033826 [Plecturocebus cupreus]
MTERAQPEETSFAKPCHLEGNFGIARVAGGEAGAQIFPIAARGPRVSGPRSAATSNSPLTPDVPPSLQPPDQKGPPPPPQQPSENHWSSLPKSKWKGKIRRFQTEQPDSTREGGKALSKRGRKSELQEFGERLICIGDGTTNADSFNHVQLWKESKAEKSFKLIREKKQTLIPRVQAKIQCSVDQSKTHQLLEKC